MQKIKDFFTKDILLKLVSLAFAIVVWLLVVNIDNPTQSRNFTTVVQILNADSLSSQNKFYTIPEGQNTVTFRVTAPRSIIERLSGDDFRATADMEKLEEDKRVPIDIYALAYVGAVNISSRQYYLNVEIGNEVEKKFMITAQPDGEPASGFVVSNMNLNPNIITIRGPEEIVSEIDKVVAVCDVNGMSSRISENVVPSILDRSGNRIDTSRLTVSLSTVNVMIDFTNVATVPIVLEEPEVSNPEVEISSITITPETVSIMGDSSILNDITEIVIPKSVIDLETISQNVTTTVDIRAYLPEGVSLAADSRPEVKVEVVVSQVSSMEIEVPISNIVVRNLDRAYSAAFTGENILITISGLPSVINGITGESLTGHVDLSGIGVGEHTVKVEMDEMTGVTFGSVTVKLNITEGE